MPTSNLPTNRSGSGETPKTEKELEAQKIGVHYDTQLPKLPWSRRIQIPFIAALVYSVIRILGPTLRFEVLGWQNAENVYASGRRIIWAFWHRVIIPVGWWRRNCGVVVMNTTAFDGQWTRKVIEWLGFGTAQGSSSRGGLRGLQVMAQRIAEGYDCAFTIDGPRGPKYVAKPGPVTLSKISAKPMGAFYVALSSVWVLRTWDAFMIPKPFSKALVRLSRKILVPPDADETQLHEYHAQLQASLERVTAFAEENVERVGSAEFPVRTR